MRILYRFFFLLAISSLTVLSGCREDEDLNLLTYPDNNFTLAADDEASLYFACRRHSSAGRRS